MATGDYLYFLDGDDQALPGLMQTLDQDSLSWEVAPDVITWRYETKIEGPIVSKHAGAWAQNIPGWSTGPETLRRIMTPGMQSVTLQSTAFRADFLREHQLAWTVGCASGQDTEFMWKALAVAQRVRHIDTVMSAYVIRPGSTTTTPDIRRFDGVAAYHRAANFVAEHVSSATDGDVVIAMSSRVVPRFMDLFVPYARSHEGGGRQLLSDVSARTPDLIPLVRRAIREHGAHAKVPTRWRLFARAPELTAWYLGSPVSRMGVGRPLELATTARRHARQGDLDRLVKKRLSRLRRRALLAWNAELLRRRGPSHQLLSTLHDVWANTSYSADMEYLTEVAERSRHAQAVLECGSGLTTLTLGSLGVPTWTLEHHAGWLAEVRAALRISRVRSVHTYLAPLISYGDFDWYEVPDGLPSRFDLVICDGPPGRTRGGRRGVFDVLENAVDNATVLFDDADRPTERQLITELTAMGWRAEIRGTAKRYAVLSRSAHQEIPATARARR